MEPSAILGSVEAFVRSNGRPLTWIAGAGWSTVGLLAIGLAIRGRTRSSRAWASIAVVTLLFPAEMFLNWRFAVSDGLRWSLRAIGGEEAIRGRRPFQAAVIAAILVGSVAVVARFASRKTSIPRPLGLSLLGVASGSSGSRWAWSRSTRSMNTNPSIISSGSSES